MTDTASALALSRAAHKVKNWKEALKSRLVARDFDPDRRDRSWLDDALAPPRPGVIGKQYHRIPGKTLAEVAALKDVELEVFYRGQLSGTLGTVIENSIQIKSRVLVPERWEVKQAGVTLCGECDHREDQHDVRDDPDDALDSWCTVGEGDEHCDCIGYVAKGCIHAFESTGDKSRRCTSCGELQILVPTMALEDTEAFKQAQREAKS